MDEVTAARRSQQLARFEEWSDGVDADDLVEVDSSALRRITELADQRAAVDGELTEAVMTARRAGHSWSKIAVMLGVTKQAAQQRYGRLVVAAEVAELEADADDRAEMARVATLMAAVGRPVVRRSSSLDQRNKGV